MHRGSLLTAVGSWLDARAAGGRWLLRIDDLDAARCRSQYEHDVLAALDAFGLRSPAPVCRQSDRLASYANALTAIGKKLPLFRCDCTRRVLREQDLGDDGVCRGNCRQRRIVSTESAWRADLSGLAPSAVHDRSLGELRFDPSRHRDVILRRRDGYFSYALAVVVDDAESAVTDVVRGADLRASTPWQLALHQALDLQPPRYLHLPLLRDASGEKLSKSRQSLPADPAQKIKELRDCLRWLRQEQPPESFSEESSPEALLKWSAERWRPAAFKGLETQRLHDPLASN